MYLASWYSSAVHSVNFHYFCRQLFVYIRKLHGSKSIDGKRKCVFHFAKHKCDFSLTLREHVSLINNYYFNAELNCFRGVNAACRRHVLRSFAVILSG